MRIKCRKKEKPRTHFAYRGSLLAWENGLELFWTRVQIQGQNKRPERKLAPGPSLMVPVVGVEPTRYRYHWILSPARLPIPSYRHYSIYYTRKQKRIKTFLFSRQDFSRFFLTGQIFYANFIFTETGACINAQLIL